MQGRKQGFGRPHRLKGHDYGSNALYFVTVITRKGGCLLWDWRSLAAANSRHDTEPFEEIPVLSECGLAAKHFIENIEYHYAGVKVEEYAVLPNHVHMLIRFGIRGGSGRLIAAETTLPTVIQQFKQAMSKHLGISVWARTYIDRIVRSEEEGKALAAYIRNNSRTWRQDSLCPELKKDQAYEWLNKVNE